MPREPRVWAQSKLGIVPAIREAGADPDAALARVGLTLDDLADPDRYITMRQAVGLHAAAAEETGDPLFNLHWASRERPERLGVLAYLTTNSPTVGSAIQNLVRFFSIVSEGSELIESCDGERAGLHYQTRDPSIPNARHNDEYVVAFGLNLVRAVSEPDWCPQEVHFHHTLEASADEYARVFGAPVRFDQKRNGIEFAREFLERPNPKADRGLLPILESHAARILQRRPPFEDFAHHVRSHIEQALANGVPTLENVAGKLSMSPRTLQRRLDAVGWSFKGLVDEARRQIATECLRSKEMPVTEIAYRAGYSELSAFARAFRRWTGKTPVEFRLAAR